jgi:hypothetical protein
MFTHARARQPSIYQTPIPVGAGAGFIARYFINSCSKYKRKLSPFLKHGTLDSDSKQWLVFHLAESSVFIQEI